ncbi:uncharacterized protein PHALS_04749 [Plasmopara halstedii]|uniref:Uncharacterized protein n=1 Tax=Plasmopara halstedii TaxID=4781 RepID=A0A0P1B0E9_PLAHL|nr:uncharacterized protein PHALS_04749 [Plasmopara halstedii]CEG47598.1 hypothetical protein PHALS_04749 [Plasmopara halstedii]|eukprot:XP_024583967.1 hypothetical protein PHALS_04749 [Plasmopara halstedii]
MEAPKTTRRVASSSRTDSISSARMLEAQQKFQSVVKQELQLLLVSGTKREEAVKLLLRRIVASTEPPDAVAVRSVMRQFQMNHDDAVRALIVKQELGRLKRQGLDSFAAIEELTRKMKSHEIEEAGNEDKCEKVLNAKTIETMEKKTILTAREAMHAPEICSLTEETDSSETSMSLIQRIGQVSISSNSTPLKREICDEGQDFDEVTHGEENDDSNQILDNSDSNQTLYKSPSQVKSSNNTNFADHTPQSRKRRAFGSDIEAVSNNSTRCVKPLFSSLKKQKLCAKVGDEYFEVVHSKPNQKPFDLFKNTAAGPSEASLSGGREGGRSRGDHMVKGLHKRQRVSSPGIQDKEEFPVAEELCAHHRHQGHHLSKRRKSSNTC